MQVAVATLSVGLRLKFDKSVVRSVVGVIAQHGKLRRGRNTRQHFGNVGKWFPMFVRARAAWVSDLRSALSHFSCAGRRGKTKPVMCLCRRMISRLVAEVGCCLPWLQLVA